MGAFSRIKPKERMKAEYRRNNKSKDRNPITYAGRLYEQAMANNIVHTKGRRPEFRPSSFPMCSILVYRKLVMGASRGHFEGENSAASDFFTSIGTKAHENIQLHMGYTGQVFGDWKCNNFGSCSLGNEGLDIYNKLGVLVRPGKITRKNSTDNLCPECSLGMEYIEKEIVFRGLKGHIDGIIKLPDGGYWVIDYKTTTKYKLDSGKLPVPSHLKQLPTYCYVLKKKYKLDVRGFSLLYFSRDNPFDYLEVSREWNGKWDSNISKLILDERRKFSAGVQAFDKRDYTIAVEQKPCATRKFYEEEMGFYSPCPMLESCFNKEKLNRELKLIDRTFKYTDKKKKKLVEAINI